MKTDIFQVLKTKIHRVCKSSFEKRELSRFDKIIPCHSAQPITLLPCRVYRTPYESQQTRHSCWLGGSRFSSETEFSDFSLSSKFSDFGRQKCKFDFESVVVLEKTWSTVYG